MSRWACPRATRSLEHVGTEIYRRLSLRHMTWINQSRPSIHPEILKSYNRVVEWKEWEWTEKENEQEWKWTEKENEQEWKWTETENEQVWKWTEKDNEQELKLKWAREWARIQDTITRNIDDFGATTPSTVTETEQKWENSISWLGNIACGGQFSLCVFSY